MVAGSVGPTGAILLAHKRSLGSPIGRHNSHPRRIRRELTWNRGEISSELINGNSRKFSEERWKRAKERERERTAPAQLEIIGQNEMNKMAKNEY